MENLRSLEPQAKISHSYIKRLYYKSETEIKLRYEKISRIEKCSNNYRSLNIFTNVWSLKSEIDVEQRLLKNSNNNKQK